MANESPTRGSRQKKRGKAQFSPFHIGQMVISTTLLIAAAIVMVGGGYLLGGAFLVTGTVIGLLDIESD